MAGNIHIMYGNNAKEMVKRILDELQIEKDIAKDDLIGIKPNLVLAKESKQGATTDPDLVAGLIEYLQFRGFQNIIILEGSWVGGNTDRAFKVCGYEEISEKYNIPLINLQKDDSTSIKVKDLELQICNKALGVDYMINMPVLKGHCQTKITCALKNMKGCIPDSEKRRYHTLGLHKPIAYLNKALKQDLVIVDGIIGDLDFEEGGNPVQMNRVIVARDPVLVDSYAAELLAYDIDDIPYIGIANKLGIGSSDIGNSSVVEMNKDHRIKIKVKSRKVKRLITNVEENNACSACYGSLIHALKRMEEKGQLDKIDTNIYIGQGFKGKELDGIGVGVCCKGASTYTYGCPPKARDILRTLKT